MSRRRILSSDIAPPSAQTGGVKQIDPILFPRLEELYGRRIARLEKLISETAAADHESRQYPLFLKKLTQAQRELMLTRPLSAEALLTLRLWRESTEKLDGKTLKKAAFWQERLGLLLVCVADALSPERLEELETLLQNQDWICKQAACLLEGNFGEADGRIATLLWSVLSLCWTESVARSHETTLETPEKETRQRGYLDFCPECGSLPSAALVLTGAREGLRYLQCTLCETRWHKVRALCVVCGESGKLDYWSLQSEKAPVEIESCGDCQSYIKQMRMDREADLETLADDLATLPLDVLVEEKGFSRAGFSPFLPPCAPVNTGKLV